MNRNTPKPNLEQQKTAEILADFIMTIGHEVSLKMASILHTGNISFPQFFLLGRLMHEEYFTMKDIANTMGHSTAAATGLVDRLEKLGLVERRHSEEDRRKIFVRITSQGIDFMSKMRKELQKELSDITANIDDERAEIVQTTQDALKTLDLDNLS